MSAFDVKFKMPREVERKHRTLSATGRENLRKKSQKQLNALFRGRVKPGEVKNDTGTRGVNPVDRALTGGRVMKRRRLRLQEKQAIALEAHELQVLARQNATAAMSTLIEISQNKRAPEANRIAASQVILDRGYGKSSQTNITANVTNGKASEITADDLDNRIGKALERVEHLTNRTPKAEAGKKRPADVRKYN